MGEPTGFSRWLTAEGANRDLLAWVDSTGLDWPAVYDACPRADFLLAIAARAGVDRRVMLGVAVAIASRVADDVADEGVLGGLAELRRRVEGGLPLAELAAREDAAADASGDMLLSLGHRVVALAATTEVDPSAVVSIPGVLVELAIAGVLDCAIGSVVGSTQHELAGTVRKLLPASEIPARW